MEQSNPAPDALANFIRQAVYTAVEAARLGLATDTELVTQITTGNIINAVNNPDINARLQKGRHR